MGSTPLPLQEMIEGLQRSLAFHQDREKLHAEQQEHHASQEKLHAAERARHVAEIESVTKQLTELREIGARLGEVMSRSKAVLPETDGQVLGRKPNLSAAMDRVLATWPPELPFTASSLAEEVARRYGQSLRRGVDPRVLGAALRRRRDQGLLRQVREGRPFEEAQYRKV